MEKILVCITPQANSHRLIDRASQEAVCFSGELHILNIKKGESVFSGVGQAELLEQLFDYGSKKGGIVHALAGNNIPGLIAEFVEKWGITRIIVGEPPKNPAFKSEGVIERLKRDLGGVEIIILEREE